MKKLLSLFLAMLMVAGVVAMIPVFTVSAADNVNDNTAFDVIMYHKVITADKESAQADNGMNAKNLFDNNAFGGGSKMEGTLNGTVTVTWKTTTSATAKYYAVYTGNDTRTYWDRNPKSWKLYGSTNGTDYVELDNVGDTGLPGANGFARVYSIDNPASYQFYKIEISKDGGYFQLNEIVLFENEREPDNGINALSSNIKYLEQNTTDDSLVGGKYQVMNAVFGASYDHGFIDGNLNLDTIYGVSKLIGASDNKTVLDNTRVFIDGKEAKFNYSYLGYTHCGRNAGNGLFFGIVGGSYQKDVKSTITFLFGDEYYVTANFTPGTTALGVADSKSVYYTDTNTLISTVTFVDDHELTETSNVVLNVHDEHNQTPVTIEKIDGKTVTFKVTDFSTTHSLLEFKNQDNGVTFSMPIDYKNEHSTATGYIQTRPNADANKFDTRILVEVDKTFLKDYNKATMDIIFTLADDTTREFHPDHTTAYNKITAAGEVYTPSGDCALLGQAIIGVPKGTKSVAASVTFTNTETNATKTIALGSALLVLTENATVNEVMTGMDKYTPTNGKITVVSDTTQNSGNEGAQSLFDDKVHKHGSHQDKFEIIFKTEDKIAVTGIIFTIGNDSYASGNRQYNTWILEGSNDNGANWSLVASSDKPLTNGTMSLSGREQENVDTIPASERQAFSVTGAGAYTYYRLTVTNQPGVYCQMGEMTLYTAKTN